MELCDGLAYRCRINTPRRLQRAYTRPDAAPSWARQKMGIRCSVSKSGPDKVLAWYARP